MMQSMRKGAQGFLAVMLFGLLILSFALWGVGDVFAPSTGLTDTAIRVGDRTFSGAEIRERVQQRMRSVQLSDTSVELRDAIRLQVANQLAQELVASALFLEAAHDMDVAISDAALNAAIRANPSFQNSEGQFSQQRYVQTLAQQLGLPPAYYEQQVLRPNLARTHYVDAVTAGIAPPDALVRAVHAYRGETRTVRLAHVPAEAMTDLPEPTDATLRAYYDEHPDAFTAPEYRALTVAIADPDRLAETIEVTDDRLRREYEANRSRFETPETRVIRQMLFGPGERDKAQAAYERIQAGESFASVAQNTLSGMAQDLGEVERGGLGDPALTDAAFAAPEGGVTEPVESALGWHIFKVEAVKGGDVQPLSEVRDQLVAEIRADEAVALAIRMGNDLEAEVAAGRSLEEAAETVGAAVVDVPAMDREGRARDGEPVEGLPRDPAIADEAFQTPKGELGFLGKTEDRAWFLLRVDEVIPSGVRPFDEARDAVREAWLAEQREQAAAEVAEAIVGRMREGATLTGAAEAHGFGVQTAEQVARNGEALGDAVAAELRRSIFDAPEGEPVAGPAPGGGRTVAVTTEVHPADPDADLAPLRSELTEAMRNEAVAELAEDLRERIGVEIDQEIIQQVLRQ